MSTPSQRTPQRPSACPVCAWPHGFHSATVHAQVVIDPKLFKAKDWHKVQDDTRTTQAVS